MGYPAMGLNLGFVAAVSLAVAVASWSLWVLRENKPMREGQVMERDFVLCKPDRARTPCSWTEPTRWLVDFSDSVVRKSEKVHARGGEPVFVHVASGVMSAADVQAYAPLIHAVRAFVPVKVVLVEPATSPTNTTSLAHLWLGLEREEVLVVTAAMNSQCGDLEVGYYTFSDRLFEDLAHRYSHMARRSLKGAMQSWRMPSADALVHSLRNFIAAPPGSFGSYFEKEVLPIARMLYKTWAHMDYIVQAKIRCINAPALLKEAAIAPSSIVVLGVEGGGVEGPILNDFTALHGFRPVLERWEGSLGTARGAGLQSAEGELVIWHRARLYYLGETGSDSVGQHVVAYSGGRG